MKTEKKKVLHLIHNLEIAGAQVVLFNLVTELNKSPYIPVVATYRKKGKIYEKLDNNSIKTFFIPKGIKCTGSISKLSLYIRIITRALKLIKDENISLIHAHMPDSAILGSLLSCLTSLPLVVTLHSSRLQPFVLNKTPVKRRIRRAFLLLALRLSRSVIAVSDDVRDMVIKETGVREGKVFTILNGVSVNSPLCADTNPVPGMPRPVIMAVGRHVKIKGFDQIIGVGKKVIKKYPNASFCMVGQGSDTKKMQQRVKKLGIEKHFFWPGQQDNIYPWLKKADIFVSTSHYEGIPIAVLEAMSLSIPVVASDVSGNKEVIAHMHNGLLYPLNDIDKLFEGISFLLDNKHNARKMGASAKQTVVDKFSIEKMASLTTALYGAVLNK